ncbi:hypothetical protein OK016_21455 [Vibrio chagasii]|nr:hypothetical protein [Vibrio chagasii]
MDCNTAIGTKENISNTKGERHYSSSRYHAVYHETARETLSRFAEWNLRFEQNADLIMPVTQWLMLRLQKQLAKSAFS